MQKKQIIIAISFVLGLGGCTSEQLLKTSEQVLKTSEALLNTIPQTGVHFTPSKIPENDAEKRSILTSDKIIINGKSHLLNYQPFLRSGDKIGNGVFGALTDRKGNIITTKEGQAISNRNDYTNLFTIDNKHFILNQFEDRPGAIYLTEVEQNPISGILTPLNTKSIDLSKVRGGWVFCGGMKTAWNSFLSGEEYDPDAEKWQPSSGKLGDNFEKMADYFEQNPLTANPYDYGWMVETKILNKSGETSVAKHYSMGRFAHELGYVLPDNKTVYLTDDGNNTGFFMFVADKENDLNSGSLYAAKWVQTSEENGGAANIEWIALGHSSSDEINQFILDKKPTFQDMFDKAPVQSNQSCPEGFKSVNSGGYKPHSDGNFRECLKIKPGMDKIASRLETRRYAAMLGATTEFNKLEGLEFDPQTQTLFLSMSYLEKGTENFKKYGKLDQKYDEGGYNDIKLPFNRCGGLYALEFHDRATLGTTYAAKSIKGFVMGNMTQTLNSNSKLPAYSGNLEKNGCDINGLANPDNLAMIPNSRTLLIAEDTDEGHQNDAVWALDLDSKKLTRVMTGVYGSEMTSLSVVPNLNGFSYIFAVVQHPFGETDKEMLQDKNELFGYTGYLGPFPALSK